MSVLLYSVQRDPEWGDNQHLSSRQQNMSSRTTSCAWCTTISMASFSRRVVTTCLRARDCLFGIFNHSYFDLIEGLGQVLKFILPYIWTAWTPPRGLFLPVT